MKTLIFYDNTFIKAVFKVVNAIFGSNYYAIMLVGLVFTKYPILSDETKNHESIHVAQYWDCFVIGLILALYCSAIYVLCSSSWYCLLFLIIPVFLYYFLYLGEYLYLLIRIYLKQKFKNLRAAASEAYQTISFEQEAYDFQDEKYYLEDRCHFFWLHYFK